jgi:hypothetical protein
MSLIAQFGSAGLISMATTIKTKKDCEEMQYRQNCKCYVRAFYN